MRFEVLIYLRMFIYILSEVLLNLSCTFALFPVYKLEYEVSDKRKVAESPVTRDFLAY